MIVPFEIESYTLYPHFLHKLCSILERDTDSLVRQYRGNSICTKSPMTFMKDSFEVSFRFGSALVIDGYLFASEDYGAKGTSRNTEGLAKGMDVVLAHTVCKVLVIFSKQYGRRTTYFL